MVHRSVPYSSSLFLFIGNNLCGRQQRFLVTTIASLCVVVSPDNQTVNQEVEMGFWGRVQYLLVTTEPGKSLFTLHEIGGGIQSSDWLGVEENFTIWLDVIFEMQRVDNFFDFQPHFIKRGRQGKGTFQQIKTVDVAHVIIWQHKLVPIIRIWNHLKDAIENC